MKKTINDIFDKAKAEEINNLVNINDVDDISPHTLRVIKSKTLSKVGLSERTKKKVFSLKCKYIVAVALCFILCLSLGLLIFVNSNSSNAKPSQYLLEDIIISDLEIDSKKSEYVRIIDRDWLFYNNAIDLTNAATNIYSGVVKDISFTIVDYATGTIDVSPESKSTHRALYTIYTIETTTSIKGSNPEEISVCILGGIPGYKEENQFSIQEKAGLFNDDCKFIPIIGKCTTLKVGKEYVFCTVRTIENLDFVINPTQFAHNIGSHNAKLIIDICK